MNHRALERFRIVLLTAAVAGLLACAYSCASLMRPATVAGGAAAGAGLGSLASPVGTVAGAAVGGAVSYLYVESGQANDRAERMETRAFGPPPAPSLLDRIAGWWWQLLLALWLWLRRAHLLDAITGKAPRMNAILCALGIRTYRTSRH